MNDEDENDEETTEPVESGGAESSGVVGGKAVNFVFDVGVFGFEAAFVIGIAVVIDAIQIGIEALDLTGVGIVVSVIVNRLIDVATGFALFMYCIVRGIKLTPARTISILGAVALEFIPIIDIAPFWFIDAIYIMLSVLAEKGALGGTLSKILAPVMGALGGKMAAKKPPKILQKTAGQQPPPIPGSAGAKPPVIATYGKTPPPIPTSGGARPSVTGTYGKTPPPIPKTMSSSSSRPPLPTGSTSSPFSANQPPSLSKTPPPLSKTPPPLPTQPPPIPKNRVVE